MQKEAKWKSRQGKVLYPSMGEGQLAMDISESSYRIKKFFICGEYWLENCMFLDQESRGIGTMLSLIPIKSESRILCYSHQKWPKFFTVPLYPYTMASDFVKVSRSECHFYKDRKYDQYKVWTRFNNLACLILNLCHDWGYKLDSKGIKGILCSSVSLKPPCQGHHRPLSSQTTTLLSSKDWNIIAKQFQ